MKLGCIGDDFTGSSDLGNTLSRAGMRCVQYVGVPDCAADRDVEAGIIALKSRSIPADQAVEMSLRALKWLRDQGCEQILFKYCSTFDSTDQGNIGPVARALAAELGEDQVIYCPAFPAVGRKVFQGHLFVNDRLLSDSGMQNHPLTPMNDPDLRRVLAAQLGLPVGHIPAQTVWAGAEAVAQMLQSEADAGRGHAIADAVTDADLRVLGAALKSRKLITGGSGIALGLPANFGISTREQAFAGQSGRAVCLSGSCSNATREQVAAHDGPKREITVAEAMAGDISEALADWALAQDGLPLIYSSADPAQVLAAQERHGKDRIAAAFEGVFARTAQVLALRGVAKIITAGGETSGAVVEALAPKSLQIGPEIDPGVPMMRAAQDLVLALKSGNFGGRDFFTKAAQMMEVGR